MIVSLTIIFVSYPALSFFGNRGKLKPSKEVNRSFENGAIKPNHRYFLSGSMSRPTAIIALSNEVELDTTFWVEVEMESKALKFLTEHMKAVTAGDDPYGSRYWIRKEML